MAHNHKLIISIKIIILLLSLNNFNVWGNPRELVPANSKLQSCIERASSFFLTNRRLQAAFRAFDYSAKPLTVGIEVEGVVDSQIGRMGLAEIIYDRLSKIYDAVGIQNRYFEDIEISYTRSGVERFWKVTYDPSIKVSPSGKDISVEVVTPILETPEDYRMFELVLDDLRKAGLRAEPSSAGIHFHLGFPDPQIAELLFLGHIFVEMEDQLLKKFSFVTSRSEYVERLFERIHQVLETFDPNMTIEKFLEKFPRRSRTLNFRSLKKFGTVEFRFFNSTVKLDEIAIMYDFVVKLVKGVRSKNTKLMKYVSEVSAEKMDLNQIAEILDMKLLGAEKILKSIAYDARRAALRRYSWDKLKYFRNTVGPMARDILVTGTVACFMTLVVYQTYRIFYQILENDDGVDSSGSVYDDLEKKLQKMFPKK